MQKAGKWVKKAGKLLLTVLASTLLVVGIDILLEGMYLIGIPDIDNVEKVTISYPQVTEESKEITDAEQIELAVKLSGFLKYSLFEKAQTDEAAMITIHYSLRNGQTVSVSANRETVWWKGKTYALKEKDIFVNLTEGIFFMEDLAEE